ncbi:inverse autotransporter beta domain-containing protein [Xenorhabdus sp. Sc-CR9]|uniref:inverse autotransporter beta domain-containing protein n=1 Tax=Xenorhabdus sp. Sc-CR9 TaxID=2584468 RepID=UPI001F3C64AB|nr:inverse autotransporter beta domain-containing protein [Xenorhabdus sp. Sc-CR9]
MPSYLSKIIVSFIAIYTLLIPSTITTALAEGNLTDNDIYSQKINTKNNIDIPVSESSNKLLISNTHKEANIEKNSDTSNSDTPNFIARNIHAVSNILSSSPKELTEHAKSYALSKLNNTVTSEVKKWLSQFGTTRINFGLDKKGTLENTSLDLLLPIYDNKADWLFFSQFGYRNKDSRNTVNVGLGGRYFYQNWMYGLNTFYDHDLTGKNQRLGMGGEIWGDYIKLSANAYYGLSDWKKSQHLRDYHERPANGYDINGEFFLPAYPNLGAKLAYEQYFGDNVTLFNRDTKQKNPSLATLGLNYTPIPLFTLGVDYKQGESGHTETQFLANLNYKLGVPLHVQLSPDSVASMRTLAGSRYDLVERNNQIILDHQKRSTLQLSLPEVMTGYSHEEQVVTVTNNPSDKVDWLQQNNDFIKNGGKISLNAGNKMTITFPEYQLNTGGVNTYPLNFTVSESSNLQQTHHATIQVIVRPFLIKEKEVQPDGGVIADGKTPYIFTPVMTYDTVNHIPLPKDVPLNHIKWTTEPPVGEESGLSWGKPEPTSTTNEKGQLQAALVSSKPQKEVNVFLQMDGMAKTQVGTVSFDDDPAGYHIKGELTVNKKSPLIANGHDDYTFTGTVFDAQNNPVKKTKISQVKWFIKQNGTDESQNQNLIFKPLGDTTNESGELTATLASHKEIKDLQVALSIKGDAPTIEAPHPVSFIADIAGYRVQDITVTPTGTLTADGRSQFHYTATIVNINDNHRAVTDAEIKNVAWSTNQKEDNGLILVPIKEGDIFKTDDSGQLKATLASKTFIGDVRVSLTIEKQPPFNAEQVSFIADPSKYKIKELIVDPQKPITANGLSPFTYTAVVLDGNGNVLKNKEINQVKWKITLNGRDVSDDKQLVFHPQTGTVKTDKDGKLTAQLASHEPREKLLVSLSIENHKDVDANQLVSFIIDSSTIRIKGGKLDMEPGSPLPANGEASYTFTATVIDSIDNKPLGKQDIKNVKWHIMQNETKDVTDNHKFTFSALDGEVTTKDDGTLQATLKSTEALDGLTVQLSFDNQIKAKSPAFAFIPDPKTYKVQLDRNNPVNLSKNKALINDIYTYTVTVTGENSKPIPAQNVTWEFEPKTGPAVKFISVEKTTNNQGKATATLTSADKATGIRVSATVDGHKVSDPEGVNFDWPTIDVRVLGKNIIAGSSGGYKVSATVYRDENKTILYKGPNDNKGTDIKFAWLPAPEGTTLDTPSGGALTIGLDGTLQNTLTGGLLDNGSPVQNVNVCLQVIEPQTEPKACTPEINFYLDVGIEEIIVSTLPTGKKVLDGNSQDYYIYTAKIINKKTGKPLPDGYSFQNDIWSSDPAADTSQENGIPEMKFTRMDTTVTKGELIAHLSSSVGVGDVKNDQVTDGVKVTLTIPPVKGQPPETKSADIVAFSPMPHEAGLEVSSTISVNNKTMKKVFKEQNRPYNSFRGLQGRLVKLPSEDPILQNGDILDPPPQVIKGYVNIDNTTGVINLSAIGTAAINVSVKNPKNKVRHLYTYQFNNKRFFSHTSDPVVYMPNDPGSCTEANPLVQDATVNDVFDPAGGGIPLVVEFPKPYFWGILSFLNTGVPAPNMADIRGGNASLHQNVFVFDLATDTMVSGDSVAGYLFCALSLLP